MREKLFLFVLLFSLCVSQAWAFEGFHSLWQKKEAGSDPRTLELKRDQQKYASELHRITPVYQAIVDEVQILLPNIIGSLEGKGAGEKLNSEDIQILCQELKRELLRPATCLSYIRRQSQREREELVHLMRSRQNDLRVKRAEFQSIRSRLQEVTEALSAQLKDGQ